MLKNKKVNSVIALVIALVLWMYVIGDKDPMTKVTIKDVPISVINLDAIEKTGFTLLDMSDRTTNVTISGSRSVVTKKTSKDIKITTDLEGLREGKHVTKLSLTAPDDVKIESSGLEKISVSIDSLISEERSVKAVVVNQSSEEVEAAIYHVSDETVQVTGASTYVKTVSHVEARLDFSRVETDLKSLNVELTPIDKEGNAVKNVATDLKEVAVTAVQLNKKSVPVYVTVNGANDGGIERKTAPPKVITIKGMKVDIDKIESISCKPIDVGDIYENQSVPLEPVLPQGIVVANNSEKLYATVTVPNTVTKTFEFANGDIQLSGLGIGLEYDLDVNGKLSVTVSGTPLALRTLNAGNIKLSAKMDGLSEGEYKLDIKAICDVEGTTVTTTPDKLNIKIRKKNEEGGDANTGI